MARISDKSCVDSVLFMKKPFVIKGEAGWDFTPEDKQSKDILKQLTIYITNNYGRRCKSVATGCPACKMWAIYDLFKIELP